MNRKLLFIISIVISVVVGGTLFYIKRVSETEIASLRQGPLVESVYGLGTVVAPKTFQLKVAVGLMIRKIYVKEGDQVKQGDPLVSFDDGPVRNAPFSGTVTQVPFREGEIIGPNMAIVTMSDLHDLFMEVSLEQQSALRIRSQQPAIITFESLRGQKFQGKVDSIFPRDGQFIVRINLVGGYPDGILPAMTADVAIEAGRREQVTQIPLAAVSNGKVVRFRSGKKQKIDVQLGVSDGEWAEVLSGDLKLDDQLIVRGR